MQRTYLENDTVTRKIPVVVARKLELVFCCSLHDLIVFGLHSAGNDGILPNIPALRKANGSGARAA